MNPARLITIIRQDLSPGYQIAQSIHSAVEYCMHNPAYSWDWHKNGNYVIVLGAVDQFELATIINKLRSVDIEYRSFYEPDIEETTSVTFVECEDTLWITEDLPLAGSVAGIVDKDFKQ